MPACGRPSARMRRAPRASRRPPPCCRRRGSSRPRSGRRRPRRPARAARSAAPCRGARRGRAASPPRSARAGSRCSPSWSRSRAGVVLVGLEAELASSRGRDRRPRAPAGRAGDRRQLEEELGLEAARTDSRGSACRHDRGRAADPGGLLGEAVDTGPRAIFVADEEMRYVAVNAYAARPSATRATELLELRVTDVAARPRRPSSSTRCSLVGKRTASRC